MPFFPNEVRKARARQPAGAPGGKGGEFAPNPGGGGGGGARAGKPVVGGSYTTTVAGDTGKVTAVRGKFATLEVPGYGPRKVHISSLKPASADAKPGLGSPLKPHEARTPAQFVAATLHAAKGPVTAEERNRLGGLRASVSAASRHHFDAQSAHSAALRAQQRVRGNGKRAQAAAELVERTRQSAESAERHYRGVESSLKELASSLRARQPDFED